MGPCQPEHQKKPGIRLYQWKYDDGSWGYGICNISASGKKRYLACEECSRKSKMKKAFKTAQEDNETTLPKKLNIPAGISHINLSDLPKRDPYMGEEGIAALESMLASCGTDLNSKREMLNLVSAILAGYCARVCCDSYQDHIPPIQRRAPVVSVTYTDYAFHVLECVVNALSFDTTCSGKLKIKYAPVLPANVKHRKITDAAYLKLHETSKRLIPQYRDTVLLVNGRFYTGTELTELQRRNLWVSLILFDCSAKKKALGTPLRVKGDVLAKSECDWNSEALGFAVARYIHYLARHAREKKSWRSKTNRYFWKLEEMLFRYNQQPNISPVRRQEKFGILLRMLALRLFLNACVEDGDISSEEGKALRREWYQVLLPGCCTASEEGDFDAAENAFTLQQQFEHGISKLLEENYPQRFLFVPDGGYCERADPEDEGCTYWGYIRWYNIKGKAKKTRHLCLQLRKEPLINLLDHYCGDGLGEKLYKELRALGVGYIHPVEKARLYADQLEQEEGKSVDALTLFIERMTFLPDGLREELQERGNALQNKSC